MDYDILEKYQGPPRKYQLMTTDLLVHQVSYFKSFNIEFPHSHPFHEIYYMLEGSAVIRVDDSDIILQKEDLLYMNPGVKHFCCNFNDNSSYMVLSFELLGEGDKNLFIGFFQEPIKDEQYLLQNMIRHRFLHGKNCCGCREEVESVCRGIASRRMGEFTKISNHIPNFFIAVIQSFSDYRQRPDFDQIINIPIINKAERIASYIKEHCTEDLSLQDVSDAMNFSLRHLQRIIAEYYNTKFLDMLHFFRIGHAKQLLNTTKYSVEYISSLCGFSDAQIMYKYFRKIEGVSPSAYRRTRARTST
jgi:AraC-like DNA-binding protein